MKKTGIINGSATAQQKSSKIRLFVAALSFLLAVFFLFKMPTFAQTASLAPAATVVTPTTLIDSVSTTTPAIDIASSTTATSSTPTTPPTNPGVTEVPASWTSVLPKRPWDVAFDGTDYIVTAVDLDHNASRLLKVTPSGTISIIASFKKKIFGVAIDGADYVVTDGNGNLLKISAKGAVTTIATEVTTPNFPADVALQGSDYVVTDYNGGRLLDVAQDGTVSVIASGLKHITSVLPDGASYLIGANSHEGEPMLYRIVSGAPIPFVNLRAWLGYGTVGKITKVASDYYIAAGTSILRVTPDGSVSVIPTGHNIQGLTNDGSNIIATDFSKPKLLQISIATSTIP